MKRYIAKRKWLFLLMLAAILLFNIGSARATVLKQKLIDTVLALDAASAPSAVVWYVAVSVLSSLAYMASQLLQNNFAVTMMDDMRKGIFAGIARRSRKDFFSVNHSDYVSAITNDLKLIRGQFFSMLFLTITFGGCMAFSAVLMLWYSPVMAAAAVLCAALMTILPTLLSKRMKRLTQEHSEKLAGLNTLLTELFSGFQVLRSFGAMGRAREKFNQCSTALKQSEQKYNGMDTFSDAFAQFLSALAQTTILVLCAWMVLKGRMSAGGLVAFSALNGNFCSSLSVVLMGIPMLRGAKPLIKRVNDLADYQPPQAGDHALTFEKALEVKHLSFSYQADQPILKDLSFSLRPGEKCALLGESGSGKTTLIRLLTGELDGYSGEICYDSVALTQANSEAVCRIAAVIHQDVFLFDDTIRNNICLFEQFSEEELEQALQLSGVSKFIHQFAQGVDYPVGQRGEFLSGGQRQRIAIARALIRHTPVLILDEGTSALDAQTAREIEEELLHIPDLTLLTITHHLQSPEDYSQILELKRP